MLHSPCHQITLTNSANWRLRETCRIKDQRLSVLDGSIPSAISHQQHRRHSKCFQTVRHNNCNGNTVNSNLWQSVRQPSQSNNSKQTPPQDLQASTQHPHHTESATLTTQHQLASRSRLRCDLQQTRSKFLQCNNNKNRGIGGSSAKGVIMPCNKTLARPTGGQARQPQHGHPPTGPPNPARESQQAV
jgi:hypothetical protein